MKKWVYLFNEFREVEKATGGQWDDVKGLVGGKGAGLLDMTRAGVPVPPFFVVTTEACNAFQKAGKFPAGMWSQELEALKQIEKRTGKKFGGKDDPLLVSCRSGAKFSMPGMMDTVLNLGLTDESAAGMAKLSGNPRFVYDFIGASWRCLARSCLVSPMRPLKSRSRPIRPGRGTGRTSK